MQQVLPLTNLETIKSQNKFREVSKEESVVIVYYMQYSEPELNQVCLKKANISEPLGVFGLFSWVGNIILGNFLTGDHLVKSKAT